MEAGKRESIFAPDAISTAGVRSTEVRGRKRHLDYDAIRLDDEAHESKIHLYPG